MKKRMVSLLMCAMLSLGMVTMVMAEGSPETKVKAVTEIKGEKVELVLQDIADFETIYSLQDLAAYVKDLKNIDVAEEEIKNLTVYDVELPDKYEILDEYEIPKEGILIEFQDISIQKGDNYLMFHEKDDGEMEDITIEVEDGSIIGRFTSLSPVIYFKIEKQDQKPDPVPPKPPVEPEKEPEIPPEPAIEPEKEPEMPPQPPIEPEKEPEPPKPPIEPEKEPEISPEPPIEPEKEPEIPPEPPIEPEKEPEIAPEPAIEPEKEPELPSQPPVEPDQEPVQPSQLPIKPEEAAEEEIPKFPEVEEVPEWVEPVEEIVSPKTADTGNSQAILCLAVLSLGGILCGLRKSK